MQTFGLSLHVAHEAQSLLSHFRFNKILTTKLNKRIIMHGRIYLVKCIQYSCAIPSLIVQGPCLLVRSFVIRSRTYCLFSVSGRHWVISLLACSPNFFMWRATRLAVGGNHKKVLKSDKCTHLMWILEVSSQLVDHFAISYTAPVVLNQKSFDAFVIYGCCHRGDISLIFKYKNKRPV